jgi:hypothetical protein
MYKMGFFLSALWIWIFLCCLPGAIAKKKGNSYALAFVISILLSPLIGFIFALVQKPNQDAIDEERLQSGLSKKCPFCAELIKKEARVCRYCGRDINPQRGTIEELWRESGIGRDTNPQSETSLATEKQIEDLWRKSGISSPRTKSILPAPASVDFVNKPVVKYAALGIVLLVIFLGLLSYLGWF